MFPLSFADRLTRPLEGRPLWPAVLFVVIALLLGGAGSGYPLAEAVVELAAIGVIVRVAVAHRPTVSGWAFRAILIIFAAWLMLGSLQLIPLPPGLWQALPARATAVAIYGALGWADAWHPASLTPGRTVHDMLAMLPAIAAFLVVATQSMSRRVLVLRAVVGVALVGTLFGAIQAAAGGAGAPVLFETIHRGYGVGFFVNRNHQAALLLVTMALAAVPGVIAIGEEESLSRSGLRGLTIGIIAFLALGVLATASRTGMVLLPLALMVAVALVLEPRSGETRRGSWRRYWFAGALAVYAVAGVALYRTALVQNTLARFATTAEDLRYQYWDNTRYAIDASLPWGTGFGSFAAIYRAVEPLSQVAPPWVNHAHCDYLELALEGGLAAIVLMAAGLFVTIGAFGDGLWRRRGMRKQRVSIIAGAAGVMFILLCSVVDYPLRMAAIGVLFGILLGLAVPPARVPVVQVADDGFAGPVATRRQLANVVTSIVVGAVVGWLALSGGLSLQLARAGQPALAVGLAPWLAEGWTELANQQQIAGRSAESAAAARQALRLAPLDAEALRAVASAELAQHRDDQGAALMQLGAALGWRDTVTQLWLARRALEIGQLSVATERIDGLLRRSYQPELMLRQLRAVVLSPGGSEAIVARLAQNPPWQQGFVNAVAEDGPTNTAVVLDLLRHMRRARVPLDTEATALIRWRLADAGKFAAVKAVWELSGGNGLIGNGDFEQTTGVVPAGAAPFSWSAPATSGVHLTIAEADSGPASAGRSLLISSDGFVAEPVLAQTVMLEPGDYRLGMWIRGFSGPKALQTRWTLSCLVPGISGASRALGQAESVPQLRGRYVTATFNVPNGCAGQKLALGISQSDGQPFTLQIDAVRLRPVQRVDG